MVGDIWVTGHCWILSTANEYVMKMNYSRSALTGRTAPTCAGVILNDSDNTGSEIEPIDVACPHWRRPYYADVMYTHIQRYSNIFKPEPYSNRNRAPPAE